VGGAGTVAEDEMNGERGTDARLWHPWLRINRVLHVMLHTRWTQLGDVIAECGVPGSEVVARCPGLARWRRTPWDQLRRPGAQLPGVM
jgi:hypothetical protein